MAASILASLFVVPAVAAQPSNQAVPPSQPNAAQAQTLENLPWPAKLGLRSNAVTQAFPLVDRVVLVPDAETYLDELKKWSPRGRWPVLIEDPVLAPMFVRRFQPAQLIRRVSVKNPAANDEKFRPATAELDAIIVHTYGGDPAQHSVRNVFDAQKYAPPGVVIASVDDPAWTAAIALAAGHGQPIAWLEGSFGQPNDELDQNAAAHLLTAIDDLIAQQNYKFRALGDDIDTITVCRALATRARMDMAAKPGGPYADGPVALTDLIGRNADGTRYALTGWIFGDEARSAYMAMCALFLPRESIMMCNTYPANDGWNAYATAPVASALANAGYQARSLDGDNASERGWLRNNIGGVSADMIVMNTKGNTDFFDMSNGQCHPHDVPVLNEPATLHLIHSWSMEFPLNMDTVGAQWLDRGVYAAVGSCWEPYLAAFVPPSELANRWVNMVPFLVAARWWDGQSPLAKPWRIVTIGDPLFVCAAPRQIQKNRVAQPADYGIDLTQQTATLMREAENDATGAKFAAAEAILNMLGKDEIACDLWRIAAAKNQSAAMARAALEPLFRRREVEEFMRAWDQITVRDPHAVDMLWSLLVPRLSPGNGGLDQNWLLQLQSTIRFPKPQHDLARLAPALARAFGNAQVQQTIDREMQKVHASDDRQALADLLRQY